jgi:hypothetical protein
MSDLVFDLVSPVCAAAATYGPLDGYVLRAAAEEVRREPARPGPARRHWGYAAIDTLGADTTVTPLAAPAGGHPCRRSSAVASDLPAQEAQKVDAKCYM